VSNIAANGYSLLLCTYLVLMLAQNIFTPYKSLEEACQQFYIDLNTVLALHATRYLNGRKHHVASLDRCTLLGNMQETPLTIPACLWQGIT
jgi:hypothetical protein